MVAAVARYMDQNKVGALEIFQRSERQRQLAEFLHAEKVDEGEAAKIKDPEALHNVLKEALVALHQRPVDRDYQPDPASWLKHLASIYEARWLDWPRFPMDRAPWPLLMPLYHAYPLNEAQYIWEAYQGKHGWDHYHSYGPYVKDAAEWALELHPSPWHWDAWPDVIIHGGVCTTMAPMSVELHVALCEPAMMAGQPGHCDLFSFKNAGNLWYTEIEQSLNIPALTWGSWLFNEVGTTPGLGEENDRPWSTAEYQLGLSQAMNVGLTKYVDTRIAVNLYLRLPPEEASKYWEALLTQATQNNPFNPAPWYLLAQRTKTAFEGMAMVKTVTSRALMLTQSGLPSGVQDAKNGYWDVVKRGIVNLGVVPRPAPTDREAALKIYDFLQTAPGVTNAQRLPFFVASEGREVVEDKLQQAVEHHVASRKKVTKEDKSAEEQARFEAELDAYIAAVGKKEGHPFIVKLAGLFSPFTKDDPYRNALEAAKDRSE